MNIRENNLKNTDIPFFIKKNVSLKLLKFSKETLLTFIEAWCESIETQPYIKNDTLNDRQLIQEVLDQLFKIKKKKVKVTKQKIVEIIFKYWPKGLNLLQYSQIDCELLVKKINTYYWVKSTVTNFQGNKIYLLVNSKKLVERLKKELGFLYILHVYNFQLSEFPAVFIRIQLFDYYFKLSSSNSEFAKLASNKPFFLAFPFNCSNIIHSIPKSKECKMILQTVERCLSKDYNNNLKLTYDENQVVNKSFESVFILNANSRFRNTLGPFASYADGVVDLLPFDAPENHNMFDKTNKLKAVTNMSDVNKTGFYDLESLKKIANLKFKGNINGIFTSKKLYDDKEYNQLLSNTFLEDNLHHKENLRNELGSIAPVQNSEFLIEGIIDENDPNYLSSVLLKFSGNDVFGGLHELSISCVEKNKMVINPFTIPLWLTGEEIKKTKIIRNSKMTKQIE